MRTDCRVPHAAVPAILLPPLLVQLLVPLLALLLSACDRPNDKPPVPKVSPAVKLTAIGFHAARLVPGMEPGAAEKKPGA